MSDAPLRKLAAGSFSKSKPTCAVVAAANLSNARGSICVFSTPEYHKIHGGCPACVPGFKQGWQVGL